MYTLGRKIPSLTLKWVKQGITNFVCRLTMASTIEKMLNYPKMGGGQDCHLHFGTRSTNLDWVKLSSSNFIQRLNTPSNR